MGRRRGAERGGGQQALLPELGLQSSRSEQPRENDGVVPPCSTFKPGTTYWITDDHEWLCDPGTCGGDAVLGSPGKGALTIHGGSFQRWLLPAPQDNGTADSSCGLTDDKPGPDPVGFQVLS